MKNTYDARQRNIGVEPPAGRSRLRRRLMAAGAGLLVVILLVLGYSTWWSMTHVRTQRAAVCATVVNLSSEVDARLVELHVQPGQRVTKGQLVVRLDDSALRAALEVGEAEKTIKESLYAQAAANARLTEVGVDAEIALAQTQMEIAQAQVTSTEAALALRRTKIPAEIRRAQAQRNEAQARLQRLQKGLREEGVEMARAKLATARARASLSALQVKLAEDLVKRNVESPLALEVRKTDLVAEQNAVREAEMQLAQIEAGPTVDELEAARQTLAAREADLSLAESGEKEPEGLEADLAMRRAELRQAETQFKRAQAQRARVAVAKEQVKAAAAELKKAEADVAGRRALLRGMSIVSPVTGVVLRTFEREGEVCRKGVPTVLVADEGAGWWVEGFVAEYDAPRVKVGQRAWVELIMGSGEMVEAKVEAVALSTSAIGRDGAGSLQDSGEMVWVKLRPAKPARSPLPGMSARAVVRVR